MLAPTTPAHLAYPLQLFLTFSQLALPCGLYTRDQIELHTFKVACMLVLVHGTYMNIQLTSHTNGGTTYSKY